MIGDAAFDQRLYTIAAKKYTEANNKLKVIDVFNLVVVVVKYISSMLNM